LKREGKNIYFSIAFSISMWFQHHHTVHTQNKENKLIKITFGG